MSIYTHIFDQRCYRDYEKSYVEIRRLTFPDMPSEFPKHMSYLEKIPNEQVRLKNWKDQLRKESNIRLYLSLGRDYISHLSSQFYKDIRNDPEMLSEVEETEQRMDRKNRFQSTWVEDTLLCPLTINSVPTLASKIGWWGQMIPNALVMLLHSKHEEFSNRPNPGQTAQFVDSLYDASNSMLTTHKFESVIRLWESEASTCEASAWLLAQYLHYRTAAIDRMFACKGHLMQQFREKHLQFNLGEPSEKLI